MQRPALQDWDRHLSARTARTNGVRAVAWSPDGTRLATAGADGMIIVRDLVQDDHRVQLQLDPVTHLSWTAAGIAMAGPAASSFGLLCV